VQVAGTGRNCGKQPRGPNGDPGPANIHITSAGAGLLGWAEARVDYTELDLAELPGIDLPPRRQAAARTAVTAWEVANGWIIEPSYARRQLKLLQSRPRLTGRGLASSRRGLRWCLRSGRAGGGR